MTDSKEILKEILKLQSQIQEFANLPTSQKYQAPPFIAGYEKATKALFAASLGVVDISTNQLRLLSKTKEAFTSIIEKWEMYGGKPTKPVFNFGKLLTYFQSK